MFLFNAFRWVLVTFTIKLLFQWTRSQNQYQRNPNKRSYQLFHPAFSSQKVLVPDKAKLGRNPFEVCFLTIFLQQFNHFFKVSPYNGKYCLLRGLFFILQGIRFALFTRHWPRHSAKYSLPLQTTVEVFLRNWFYQRRNQSLPSQTSLRRRAGSFSR